jgi:hypothetical protein
MWYEFWDTTNEYLQFNVVEVVSEVDVYQAIQKG